MQMVLMVLRFLMSLISRMQLYGKVKFHVRTNLNIHFSSYGGFYKGLFDLKKNPSPIVMDLDLLLHPHSPPLTIRHSGVLFGCSLFIFVKILDIKTAKIDKLNFRSKLLYGNSIIKLLRF